MALWLLAMKAVVTKYSQQGKTAFSPSYSRKFNVASAERVSEGLSLNPISLRMTGQKGRIKLGKIGALLARFFKYKTEICHSSSDFNLPFDNNQAERDIRISKVKMKISGGFRAQQGANVFATFCDTFLSEPVSTAFIIPGVTTISISVSGFLVP